MNTDAKDTFKVHGAMTLTLTKPDGSVQVIHKDNMILDVGFDFIADSIGRTTGRPAPMGFVAVGSGTTAPAGNQTALVTEISRVAATYNHITGEKTFALTGMFDAGVGTGAITEACVANAANAGTLLDRVTFGVINKGPDDTVGVAFTFTMS